MRHVALLSAILPLVAGAQFPAPDLDLSSLGHVVVAGQFSGISIVNDTRQTEILSTNSTDGLFSQTSDGTYTSLGATNGAILAVCALNSSNTETIFVGGNFTRIGGVSAANIASYTPATNSFAALSTGVLGSVKALYCDSPNNQVYIGGAFDISNSSNAVLWSAQNQRFNPVIFGGFDGPVSSIVASSTGSVLFGGRFDTIANQTSTTSRSPQQVNLQTAYITSTYASTMTGFSDPNNIVCPSGQDSAGSAWLLSDNQAGSWSVSLNYTIRPSKFRIYNTHVSGRGTRQFRFVFEPQGGILNLTYQDPTTGAQLYCDSVCPLSSSSSVPYQEFEFVNVVEMTGFSIDISGWYGLGGGLRGFEIYTDDVYAYAVDAFNQPTCANGSFLSSSTTVGPWRTMDLPDTSGYLSANLSGAELSTDTVTLYPQITSKGSYSVRIYTPGCLADGTCNTRGAVTVSVYSQAGVAAINSTIFQTNNYEKYDTVYQGVIDSSSSTFRPRVIVAPLAGQSGTINTVVSRAQFLELSLSASSSSSMTSSNLNGLYEFSPSTFSASASSNTTFDLVGSRLGFDATINTIVVDKTRTFVAGNFSGTGLANILQLEGSTTSALANAGLNGAVVSMLILNEILYIGGNFSSAVNSTVSAAYIVGYNVSSGALVAVGGGVNAPVSHVFTDNGLLGISGAFTSLNQYGSSSATPTQGIAFWDPAASRWTTAPGVIDGSISNTIISSGTLFIAGNLRTASQYAARGVASLMSNGQAATLSALHLPTTAGISTFDVNTGVFYNSSTKSLTILGGNFSTIDSSGNTISTVAILSNSTVSGLPSGVLSNGSILYSSHVDGQQIYLGGSITGTVGSSPIAGIFIYDAETSRFASSQPAALQGSNVQVNSITSRPGVAQIVVAGNFDSAGSLACPSLCVLDRTTTTWQRPAIGLTGNISSTTWLGQNILLLTGNMALNGTTHYIATFDFSTQTFSTLNNVNLPGPARIAVSDTNQTNSIYVAGQSSSNAYLVKLDGNTTIDLSSGLAAGTQIYDLQFVPLTRRVSSNSVMESNRNLLVLGNLKLTNGSASGALFDGVSYTPFLYSSTASARPGTIRTLFSEQLISSFASKSSKLSRGVVIVIALAIAFFIIFTIVAVGVLVAFLGRRREGYRPASQIMPEKMSALPPGSLFGESNFRTLNNASPKI